VTLNIVPQGGAFNNAIQIACSGIPTGSTCALSPNSVTPGANTATTALTISANASMASAWVEHHFALAMWLPLLGVTLMGTGKSRLRKILLGLALIAALAVCVACGGATASKSAQAPATNQQSYAVTVTATSGSIQHTLTVPFTVQ
jgi:hypothetical protein